MQGSLRPALAAAALAALSIAVATAFAENSTDKAEPPAVTTTAPPAAATPPAANSTAPPPAPVATPEMTVLAKHEVEGVLGRDVRSAADEDMGRIVDVLVDRAGQVRAAIIDFGGFLGVGSRKIAVDWNALHFPEPGKAGERIWLELTRDQVNSAPEYKDGKPVVVLGPLGKLIPLPE
jgi:hypothetical protein